MKITPAADDSNARRSKMSGKKSWITAVFVAAGLAASVAPAFSQGSQSGQPAQSQPTTQQPAAPSKSGSSLAVPQAPQNAEELAALKAFQEMPNTDLPKKIATGEEFLKKYPNSQYRPMVYSALTLQYIQSGN